MHETLKLAEEGSPKGWVRYNFFDSNNFSNFWNTIVKMWSEHSIDVKRNTKYLDKFAKDYLLFKFWAYKYIETSYEGDRHYIVCTVYRTTCRLKQPG